MNPFSKEWRDRVDAKTDKRVARITGRPEEEITDEREARAALRPLHRFGPLGVQIMDDGGLYTFNGFGGKGRHLGPAAGARAEMAAERSRHRVGGAVASTAVLGPAGLAGAIGKKAKASSFVILADGTTHEARHNGNAAVAQAQRDVVAFNAAVQGLTAAQERA